MTADNFKFTDAPTTPDEKRILELVRAVVRDELRQRDLLIASAVTDAMRHFVSRGGR